MHSVISEMSVSLVHVHAIYLVQLITTVYMGMRSVVQVTHVRRVPVMLSVIVVIDAKLVVVSQSLLLNVQVIIIVVIQVKFAQMEVVLLVLRVLNVPVLTSVSAEFVPHLHLWSVLRILNATIQTRSVYH